MSLSIRLFGKLEVLRNGEPVDLPQSKKTRALLALLAASPHGKRREHLCEMLWDVPDDPKGALRWSLSKLRGIVDSEDRKRIIADREAVRLDVVDVTVDLSVLQDGLRRGAGELSTKELEILAESVRGEFLEGLNLPNLDTFHAWCVAERESVRLRLADVLSILVERLTDVPGRAIPHARRLVAIDTFNVDARRALLRLLLAAGRRDEAKAQFEAACRMAGELEPEAQEVLQEAWREMIKEPRSFASPRAGKFPNTPKDQVVRFCTSSDNVRIAYASVGNGPPLVKTSNWLNHLEYDWESPVWRHMFRELSRDHRLIRYDERGNGLSDWDVQNLEFDHFVDDLEAVVEATEIERFPLFGVSQGAAISIGYAVRHPERVSCLVIYGGFSVGWRARNNPEEIERREAMITLMRQGWGLDNPAFRQVFTSLFIPDGTAEQMKWFNDLQRFTTSSEQAVRHSVATASFDITDLLPHVTVPVLVLHCRDDAVIPFSAGQLLAQSIPGARFKALEGRNHLIQEYEPAWPKFLAEVREFLEEFD